MNAASDGETATWTEAVADEDAVGVVPSDDFGEAEIRPTDRARPVPASAAQLGIWFFESFTPEEASPYRIPTVVRLQGLLDQRLLERAINAVVRRHDILRCSVAEVGGEVVQRPGPISEIRLPVETVAEKDVAARVAFHAAKSFDLARGPLVRWFLFETVADDHRLLILQHHIISDGRSVGLLVRELLESYGRLRHGAGAEQPSPAVQYADFAAYSCAPAQRELQTEAIEYWVEKLRDVPLLELPTDHPRPLKPSSNGRRHQFRLPAEVTSDVRRFARKCRATPYAVLFTAHALLIARYSGQNDFIVTMPVDGRNRPELDATLGCFVNLLPIRCRIDWNAGFAANLDTMSDELFEGATFQAAPFHRIVATLAAKEATREAALAKIFRSLLVLDSFNRDLRIESDGLRADVVVEADHDTTKTDLLFALQEVDDEIEVLIEYATDLFNADTIARMASHFQHLLVAGMVDPECPVSRLPILSAEEFRALTITANQTATPFPRNRSLADLFDEAARRFADRPAYAEQDLSVDYATLARRTNAFAGALVTAGLQAGERVAILLDRGLDAVIAILAIVKAGGVYVPIDPTYPDERIKLMLDDAGAGIVVVDGAVAGRSIAGGRVLLSVGVDDRGLKPMLPSRPRRADDVAYIYYTSGTTGRPRGVVVQDSAVNRLVFETNYLDYRPDLRIGFASNIVFDLATLEIWGALLHGGCLVLVPRATLLEVERFAELLREQRIDVIWLTAPLFHHFAEELPTAFAGMEAILTGGAVVAPAAVAKVLGVDRPPASVVNCYGPTETTTFAATQRFTPADVIDQSRSLPIGRAIANTRLYVVDPHGQPVPVGVCGELLIGGAGVAVGYLNRPELNREKFVALTLTHPKLPDHPVTDRVYRTGDVVRWRSDGLLEFFGRIDRQIKLRGYRVELGEIEAAILSRPNIAETIVVPRGSGSDLRLDAYYSGESAPPVEELRAYLGGRLPAYMLPQRFRHLDKMPVNVAGKVDVDALPPTAEAAIAPDDVKSDRPRSPAESVLAQIIADVLGCPIASTDNDFFALGGDSIQSIRVAGRARDRGFGLTVRDIFEHRTVARLAAVLEQRAPPRSAAGASNDSAEIALLPVQRWFFDRDFAAAGHFNLALLLKAGAKLDRARLQRSVNALVAAQEALRSRWPARPAPAHPDRQVILPAGEVREVVIGVHRLATTDGRVADEIAQVCTGWQSGFDLTAGPILAVGVIENHPDGCDRLFLAVHHLAIDIVSWWILVEQLRRIYDNDGVSAGPATDAGALGRWARALVGHANTAATARELPHWIEAISGPRYFSQEVAAGGEHRLKSERRVSAALFDAAVQAGDKILGLRPHEVTTAVAVLALAIATGGRDMTTTIEGHGREPSVFGGDLSRVIGWFTSLHPCRVRLPQVLDGRAGTIEALAEIKDALRSAPNNGIGFGPLKYLSSDPATREALAPWSSADLSVNYLGGLDIAAGDWRLEDDSPGESVSPANRPAHTLDLTAFRADGEVVLALTADGGRIAAGFSDAFCDRMLAVLTAIAALAADQAPRLTTASDHLLSGLDRPTLARLLGPAGSAGRKVLRLTPVEEGLLFEALRHPDSNAYTIQMHWQQAGNLDLPRLQRAFEAIVQRHDALRGRYVVGELPHPVRIVEPRATIEWRVLDWRGLDEHRQEEARASLFAEDRRRGFDLTAASGARVAVLRRAEELWEIVWTYHHIFFDGWSVSILLADLASAYEGLERGGFDAERPPQFDAFLAGLSRTPEAACASFWSGELADLTAPTDLPFRLPGARLEVGGADGASVRRHVAIPASLMADVKTLSARQAVTPSSAFQFGYVLALARCARSNEVTYGTTASGRTLPILNIDLMVGLAISTVPVRVHLEAQTPVIEAVRALHAKTVAIQEHAHISLANLQQLSAIPPGERLFHSLFVYENYPAEGLEGQPGLQFGNLEILDKTDAPLTVLVVPGTDPHFEVSFDPTLFSSEAIERLCGHIIAALQAMVRNPDQPTGDIDIVTPPERYDLLVTWNATGNAVNLSRTVLDLIAETVAAHPDRVAVTHGSDSLTYRDLAATTDALARRIRRRCANLRQADMSAETVIALVVERGVAMVVSIIAVMKAGGAYLPIDPDDPVERVAFMVDDANAPLLLANTRSADRYRASFGDRLMLVGEGEGKDLADGEPLPCIASGQLAYVIYTSGSTGRPKGTLVEHRGIVNRLAWVQHEYFALTPDDRVLQKTPYTFDVSVWELFWPLVEGATLVFADPGGHRDPAYLHRVITDRAITVVHFVPSMLQVFLEHPGLEQLRTVRLVAASGEGLPTRLTARVLSALPGAKMINLYGPTEATIEVSGYVCARADEREGPMTPIGLPAWNTTLHILDPDGRLMPVGVPGELHIGGIQVARGYLNRPELTAERFIADPFGPGRLYRTGDLVRRRPNGVIDYLGRVDFQMKVRGMRVEPGEIESALEACPGVGKACVVAAENAGDGLVAYITGEKAATEDVLKHRLADTLPDHMLPARIVRLEAFPLTSSGKVDRKRLPDAAPAAMAQRAQAPAEQKMSRTEAMVAAVYSDVLKAGGRVDIDQSFFALGGHSLTAMRVAMRLSQQLGLQVPVRLVFDHSSARALAAVLDRMSTAGPVPALTRGPRTGPLKPSFAQTRVLFLERFATAPGLYNIPAAMRILGEFDEGAFERAAGALLDAHEILRTRYSFGEGEPRLEIDSLPRLDLQVADILPDTLDQRLHDEGNNGFQLESDPPIRFRVWRLGPADRVLVITLHHVVTDGWSLDLLLADLAQRYEAERPGGILFSPPEVLGYIDFAEWQRTALNEARIEQQSRYWKVRLQDAPVLEFPVDRPRPPVASYRGGVANFGVGGPGFEAIEQFCSDNSMTLFPVLLAAWTIVLSRYCPQDDFVIGTPVANRPLPETERMLGLFQNTVALRVKLRDDETVAALARRLAGEVTEDFAHQDLPFELMIEALGVARDPSRPALVQAMLIYDDRDPTRAVFAPNGLAVTPLTLGSDTAKVELTAAFLRTADGLIGAIEYATDLFSADTMKRLSGHVLTVLQAFATDPLQRVGDVDILTPLERTALLEYGTPSGHPIDRTRTILDLIAVAAAERPDAVAVVHGDERRTYRELDQASTQFARAIRDRHVELKGAEMPAETVVALILERSISMIVAILAVMKAGGAYLPIDPDDPADRIAFMLDDAAAAVIVTDAHTSERASATARPDQQVLRVDQPTTARAGIALPKVVPAQLAYVVYTSGSTGRPKGTLIEHRSLVNRMVWVQGTFALSHDDCVLQKTPYTFDVSISELLWPLAVGARLVFADPGAHGDPAYLHRIMKAQSITVMHFVPSMLEAFAAYPGIETLTSLRFVLVIGEPLPSRLSTRVLSALPKARVINLYGPTEATIDVSAHPCVLDDERDGAVVVIGRPGWNTSLHVLDAAYRLVPVGVPGELAIGGVQLARGYLNRPDLTADKFIDDPFSSGKLYRTGDLVRRRADGAIEYLGRMDFQVKIRGMRVELGEVEARLEACTGITKACVVASELAGEKRLVAYVAGPAAVHELDLMARLATELPDHMIPERIVALDAFPLTPSGKVDRKRLPSAAALQRPASTAAEARTSTEQALIGIWRDILGHESFSCVDGFFDVGGTSLGAVRIVSAISNRLGKQLPIVSVFRHPSIRDLAAHFDGQGAPDADDTRLDEARGRAQARRVRRAAKRQ